MHRLRLAGVAGGGVQAAEAWEELREVAEMLQAPVVMSVNGRGSLSDRHPLATLGHSLPALLPSTDAILAVGTRLLGSGNVPVRAPADGHLIRIDADPTQLNRTVVSTIGIAADAKLALAELAARIGPHNRQRPSRGDEVAAINRVITEQLRATEPQASLGLAMRAAIPDDAIVIDESCQVGYWSRSGMPGVRAEGAEALVGALREALTHNGPLMIEVPVGPMPNFQRGLRERLAERLVPAGAAAR